MAYKKPTSHLLCKQRVWEGERDREARTRRAEEGKESRHSDTASQERKTRVGPSRSLRTEREAGVEIPGENPLCVCVCVRVCGGRLYPARSRSESSYCLEQGGGMVPLKAMGVCLKCSLLTERLENVHSL